MLINSLYLALPPGHRQCTTCIPYEGRNGLETDACIQAAKVGLSCSVSAVLTWAGSGSRQVRASGRGIDRWVFAGCQIASKKPCQRAASLILERLREFTLWSTDGVLLCVAPATRFRVSGCCISRSKWNNKIMSTSEPSVVDVFEHGARPTGSPDVKSPEENKDAFKSAIAECIRTDPIRPLFIPNGEFRVQANGLQILVPDEFLSAFSIIGVECPVQRNTSIPSRIVFVLDGSERPQTGIVALQFILKVLPGPNERTLNDLSELEVAISQLSSIQPLTGLIIVAIVGGFLHFRMFDGLGPEPIVNISELDPSLRGQQARIQSIGAAVQAARSVAMTLQSSPR